MGGYRFVSANIRPHSDSPSPTRNTDGAPSAAADTVRHAPSLCMFDEFRNFALFDDNLDDSGDLLLDELESCIRCDAVDGLQDAFAAIAAAGAKGHWVAVAASYELGYALEPRLAPLLPDGYVPLLTAWIFRRAERMSATQTSDRIEHALSSQEEHQLLAGVADIRHSLSEIDYCSAVSRIRELIDAGDCYQVNFTLALTGCAYGSPLALYQALRLAQPVRHGTLIRHSDGAILSRSPELFVERHGSRLVCRPMKGTAARDSDPQALAESEKNRAENIMIVDLIRNDLGRLAPSGGVRVERLCEIEPYPSVWQMTSTVVAEPVSAKLPEIFRALFPCGSVTGAPKIRAMQVIHELESAPRGLYCGALGWIAPDGDFRFSVPIRTLEIDAEGQARLGLGSGIVADSEPQAEWAESLLKGRFLTDLKAGFGLIETLRCEPDAPVRYPLLELHLTRLAKSAETFGFVLDLDAVRSALENAAAAQHGPQRVRLILDPEGRFSISSTALETPPQDALPTVVVSSMRVSSRDPLLRHKTTARKFYDTELRRVMADGHFDALFLNEHGELAEGARSNVFLDLGEAYLLTPPLESGALDGIYRRKLLNQGKAKEARLTAADLSRARAIHLANAARGIFRVELIHAVQ
nr:aminodeoxychorismate synthase component I [Aromatoleum diolicum]